MADDQVQQDTAPRRRELSAVWALPVIVAAWVWAAGWLPEWAERTGGGFPRWLMAVAGPVVLAVGVWRASNRWPASLYGPGMDRHGYALAVFSAAAVGVWLVRAAYSSPIHQTPLLLLLLAVGAVWWWQLSSLAPRRAAAVVAEQVLGPVPAVEQNPEVRRLLDASWCADIAVYEVENNRAGQRWLLGPAVVDEDGEPRRELATFAEFTNRLPRLQTQLAAYWRQRGVELDEHDVRPEQLRIDRWNVHINTRHVEQEDVPAELTPPPRSWNMPAWLGLFLDGEPMEPHLCGHHMKVVGATGGGKTVVANNVIRAAVTAHTANRRDCLVWVCASNKLKPLVWPWLEPWLAGQTEYPILDWVVGEDRGDVLEFLRGLYYLSVDRNQRLDTLSKWSASPTLPGVCVVLEEGKHLTGTSDTVEMDDGQEWTASRLIAELAAQARSAAINLVALTQQGLFDGLGQYGDEMQRNFTIRVCTVTETDSDGTNNLPKLRGQNVNTTLLENNTIYLQPSLKDTARAMPGKVSFLDESSRIVPVVLEASKLPPPVLEPEGVEALGAELYAARWDADVQTLLHATVTRRGWTWPGTPAMGRTRTARAAEAAAAAEDDDEDSPPVTPPVTPAQGPVTAPVGPPVAAVTRPGPDGAHDGDSGPDDWRADWDKELNDMLGRGSAARDRRRPPPPTDRDAHGLPGEASMQNLEELARRMSAEADASTPPLPSPSGAGEGLPEPLRSVVVVAAQRAAAGETWVATAELTAEVWGVDDEVSVRKLGKAISLVLPGLRTTDPRSFGAGRRGRGYVLAEMKAAVARYREQQSGA